MSSANLFLDLSRCHQIFQKHHQQYTNMNKCKKCGGTNCTCKKSIHELAKAFPNKTYNEIEKMRQEDLSYESSGEVVIDDTNECESCQ